MSDTRPIFGQILKKGESLEDAETLWKENPPITSKCSFCNSPLIAWWRGEDYYTYCDFNCELYQHQIDVAVQKQGEKLEQMKIARFEQL